MSALTRRSLLQGVAGGAAAAALAPYGPLIGRATAAGPRAPDSLPYPALPAGTPTGAFPFDHIVVVMMENHSFDNYFGMLPVRGHPRADGFTFDAQGRPTNRNPVDGGHIVVQRAPSTCQPAEVTQSWNAVHRQVDGGRMDGFAWVAPSEMLYYDQADIPFYYGLAKTFTLANRWFSSAPCQTYPNRRFLMAGTAYGNIATDTASFSDPPPPNGTIFDRLSAHGIGWRNYFTDLPATAIIPSVPERYPANLAPITQFFADCSAGTLPAVSFVDPEFGATSAIAEPVASIPGLASLAAGLSAQGGDEENPQNVQFGQAFVSSVVTAILRSPAWGRTLLVWTYDEHGGYYDHVPPPAAIKPDDIAPKLRPGDVAGAYDVYGPRVPTVVVSPYSRPGAVTSVVHDHTSILATIESQWNLPALSYRDANAATLADFLDVSHPAFAEPPALPAAALDRALDCSTASPTLPVVPDGGGGSGGTGSGSGGSAGGGSGGSGGPGGRAASHLVVRFHGGPHHGHPRARVALRATAGPLSGLVLELHRGGHVVARAYVGRVGGHPQHVTLKVVPGRHLRAGHHRLTVTLHGRRVVSRAVRVR